MNTKARKHMSKGAMRVMRTSPFYSTIVLKHQFVEDENVNGMVINGKDIRYNPEAIMTQTPAEIGEYLKAMAMKIAFKHHVRGAIMKPSYERPLKEQGISFDKVFNQSADLAVNSLLQNENSVIWNSDNFKDAPMPGRDRFEDFESGESVEKYFPKVVKLFEEEPKEPSGQNGDGDGDGSGQSGGGSGGGQGNPDPDQDDDNGDNQNNQDQEQDMHFSQVESAPHKEVTAADDEADEMIAAATMAAKGAGEQTGSVKSIIAENEKPVKVDWRAEASQFFERACRGRKNYRHVNRRLWGSDIVFPTNKDKTPKRVIFLVDVSGSMDNKAVGAVYNHIEEVIRAKPNIKVELAPFDGKVFLDHVKEFDRDNIPISTDARGRCGWGGTRFMPAAQYAEKRAIEEDVSGVVMLTDLLPCDTKEFEALSTGLPWLILSVYQFQFGAKRSGGSGTYDSYCCRPKWCKILEIEP